jgi:CRISPR-associated protein Cas5d
MYTVSFEASGPMAMFARPDSGSTPISYPVPTWSAVKGMFEAVAMMRDRGGRIKAYIHPIHVEICRPVRFEHYVTNYGGPLRKDDQVRKDNNLQLIATVLVDVCYRVFGEVRQIERTDDGVNYAHALQDRFQRRLNSGRCYYTPTLGWREFVPDYFGPLREGTGRERSMDFILPSLLRSVFDEPVNGRVKPVYRQAHVRQGVLYFDLEG